MKDKKSTWVKHHKKRNAAIIGVVCLAVLCIGLIAYVAQNQNPLFECVTSAYAYHSHVQLTIKSSSLGTVQIPALVGYQGCWFPLHTHDTSNVIHIETGTFVTYHLRDFFTIWQHTGPNYPFSGMPTVLSGSPQNLDTALPTYNINPPGVSMEIDVA